MDVELEENLSISDITQKPLQHEKTGPHILEAYKKMRSEKSSTDGCFIISMSYACSPLQDFESYLRIVVGLDEDDIQLILKKNSSNFVTYEISPGISSIKLVQRLFTLWVIKKGLYKLNMMILA